MLKFTSFLSTIFLLFLGITVQAQTTCPAPYQVSTESDSNKIIVKWASQSTTSNANTTYTVAYAVAPTTATSVWTTLPATPNKTLTISNLSKCTNYNVRVKSNCSATSSSTWTPAAVVKTKGCIPCLKPVFTSTTEIDSTSLVVYWQRTAASFEVQYTTSPVTSNSVWITGNTSTKPSPHCQVTGLQKCKEYTFRVRANCNSVIGTVPTWSDWSEYKSLKTKGCTPVITCLAPSTINATADSNKIALSWLASTIPSATYTIEYTAAPFSATSVWTTATSTTTTFTLANLSKCKEYAYRIKTNCSAISSSGWSSYKITKTTGCVVVPPCLKPVYTTVADSNKVTLSWATITGSTYQVQYAAAPISSTTAWINATATTSPATITGLLKCKEYVIRVRKVCSNNTFSDWETKTVKTTGCVVAPPCSKPIYTTVVDSNKITLAWTTIVGSTYQVQYAAAPVSSTTAWNSIIVTTNPATITDLLKCKEYVIRVRKVCSNNTFSDWETKTVKTTGCVQKNCPKPAIFGFVEDSTKVSFAWTALPGIPFHVAYTAAPALATSTWTSTTITANPLTISGLTKCKEYVLRIRSVCASDYLSEWETKTFKTKGCPPPTPCIKPALLSSTPITGGVTLNWSGTSQCYQVRYAKKTTTAAVWKTDSVCMKWHTIIDLAPCTFYAWQVRSRCSDGVWGEWTSKSTFETGGCSERIAKTMTLSPNPGTHLNVAYYLRKAGNVSLEITNLQGVPMGKYELGKQEVGENTYSLDNFDFAAGSYLVFIKVNGIRLEVQRWIKNVE